MWSMWYKLMLTNILIFVHTYVASKIEKKEKNEEKVTMKLRLNFSNNWLMVRLNLSLDKVRNCEETTTFERTKTKTKALWTVRRKELSIFYINKDLFLEKLN